MSKNPTLDKMLKIRDKSQVVGDFLSWLQEQDVILCNQHEHDKGCENEDGDMECGIGEYELLPVRKSIEAWLAEYFEIDLNKAEEERQAILENLKES